MKNVFFPSRKVRIVALLAVAFVLLGFALRKPLLIVYHRNLMINTWQTHVGLPQPTGWLDSQLQSFGLVPPPPKAFADPNAMGRAFEHLAALVRLGYFTQRHFVISPLSVNSEEYKQLRKQVAEVTGQQPTARFDFDDPASPSKVLGLTVYATPEDMPRWEQFVAGLTKTHD